MSSTTTPFPGNDLGNSDHAVIHVRVSNGPGDGGDVLRARTIGSDFRGWSRILGRRVSSTSFGETAHAN